MKIFLTFVFSLFFGLLSTMLSYTLNVFHVEVFDDVTHQITHRTFNSNKYAGACHTLKSGEKNLALLMDFQYDLMIIRKWFIFGPRRIFH